MVKRSNLMLLALVTSLSFFTASCGKGSVPAADLPTTTPGISLAVNAAK